MTPRTIALTGARGGHCTTTVAAALALFAAGHGSTILLTDDPTSSAALLGVVHGPADAGLQVTENLVLTSGPVPNGQTSPDVVVVDAGRLQERHDDVVADERYLVLRGPCYVALAGLVADHGLRSDGIILIAEPKRSLTARDVTDVLDIPVIASIEASSDVARTVDAGLLVSRLHRLSEFAPLRALATDAYAGRLRPSTAHPRRRNSAPNGIHTDLPLSQSDNGAEGSRVAHRPCGPYVDEMWNLAEGPARVEHWPARTGRGRLLHRRDRDLGRGLLHRQG